MQQKYQKGQSLVEVIIALSIAVIVIVAFTNATIAALRDAQFAKNQNTATRIAQKTIELVRVVRDQNNNVGTNPWSNLWSTTFPNRCYTLDESALSLALDASCLGQTVEGIYTRKIQLSSNGTCSGIPCPITVYVEISWNDGKGTHSSQTSTQLTNWQ